MLIILVIIILIFGASRLPEIGKGIGQGIKNFKSSVKDPVDEGTPKNFLKPSSSEDEPRLAHSPRHPLAVQPLEQRNRKLARHAVAILERRHVHRGAPAGAAAFSA